MDQCSTFLNGGKSALAICEVEEPLMRLISGTENGQESSYW